MVLKVCLGHTAAAPSRQLRFPTAGLGDFDAKETRTPVEPMPWAHPERHRSAQGDATGDRMPLAGLPPVGRCLVGGIGSRFGVPGGKKILLDHGDIQRVAVLSGKNFEKSC